eukprot:Nk52_evm49s1020 gene=Nk52_evmTU49s1020
MAPTVEEGISVPVTASMGKKGDPRMGDLIVEKSVLDGEEDVVLIGFPYDEGVDRNGGRVGAAKGPETMRKYLMKMGCLHNLEYGVDLRGLNIADFGDVEVEGKDFESVHSQLSSKVAKVLEGANGKCSVPFVVGGGNDESFSNVKPLLSKYKSEKIAVINIDAHLDVRPLNDQKAHSGSPFRQMLEHEDYSTEKDNFVVFAAQGSQCSADHVNFMEGKKGRVVWLKEVEEQTRKLGSMATYFNSFLNSFGDDAQIFVSFDLDSVRGSEAPGVSCASSLGLSAQDAIEIMLVSGKHPNVKLVDLSEFNPEIEDYRTGKLVANMFYYFCLGRALGSA